MGAKISLIFPDQSVNFKKLNDITVHDIGMDSIVKKLSAKENEQFYIMNVMKMMTADPYTARYRADIFDDIYKNKEMRDELLKLLDHINFLREFGSFKRDHEHDPGIWDLLHRLDEIKDYIECIEAMYTCLQKAELYSDGLKKLKDYVENLYHDNALDELKKDIKALKADTRNLKSVTVGINLNERFEASGIGVISVNNKYFTKSTIVSHFVDKLSGGDNIQNGTDWNGDYKFDEVTVKNRIGAGNGDFLIPAFSPMAFMSLKYISEAEDSERSITNYMDEITGRLLSKTVKHLKNVLGKYALLTITDITDLMPEFIYYIRWVEFIEKLSKKGFLFCKPQVKEASEEKAMDAKGVYNLKLIEDANITFNDIVLNNLTFEKKMWLYILTGANRGGKTTITQAIGQLYFLAQGGIYVPGSSFAYKTIDAIYTHFPADEDKTLDLGRLGEECKRFKEIYQDSSKDSLFLLNETFSTTSFEEGFYIAKDCIKAILKKGVRTVYNTHMHKLAYDIDEINSESEEYKAASLIVLNQGSERSYSIKVAPPEGMSYAIDIAKRYGVTFDMLTS